ncbi:hypothetical protein [Ramlibacter albus]|uniref:Uncharacterized protein n=1 Tax=Ramlibacter albus TaxID=2079448 RepID=A0A923M301_9BURK|nr:hypothetical protein [Ramlibacter albus]MBC5763212.1 hypothetical protein [Ramlibacter albus]
MNRCQRWALAALAAFATLTAAAQGLVREAPADVRPAMIAISSTPPDITLNGEPARLSPGARIRGVNNMLVLSGSVAGRTLPTVYRKDAAGLVHEVWILTPEEYSKIGGINTGDPEGFKRFAELLALIWGARK